MDTEFADLILGLLWITKKIDKDDCRVYNFVMENISFNPVQKIQIPAWRRYPIFFIVFAIVLLVLIGLVSSSEGYLIAPALFVFMLLVAWLALIAGVRVKRREARLIDKILLILCIIVVIYHVFQYIFQSHQNSHKCPVHYV